MRIEWFPGGVFVDVTIKDPKRKLYNLYFFQNTESVRIILGEEFLEDIYSTIGKALGKGE